MPLLDIDWAAKGHDFRAFFVQWSATISDSLNAQPLKGDASFLAEMACRTRATTAETIGAFLADPAYTPPPPTRTVPARFTDSVGVNVLDARGGREVAAAVQFVCPDHKESSDSGLAFAVRVASLVAAGVGVVLIDVVPGAASWAPHLHSLIPAYPATARFKHKNSIILVIQPVVRASVEEYDVWDFPIAPGSTLPTVPLPVRGAMHMKLDLEVTYTEACERSRIP